MRLRGMRRCLLLAAGAAILASGCSLTRGSAKMPMPSVPRQSPAAAADDLTRPVSLQSIRRWNPRLVGAGYATVGTLADVSGGKGPTNGGRTGTDTGRAPAGTGIWGKSDVPNVQLLVSGSVLLGVRGLFAAADGPQPWFDQQTPTNNQFMQTVWFRKPGDTGAYGLSGWDRLKAINPKLADAQRLTDFMPMLGYHWGHQGPGLVFMVDKQNRVVAVEGGFGAATGWQPMYDQLPGHVDLVTSGDQSTQMYSEHVWFVDPTSIR